MSSRIIGRTNHSLYHSLYLEKSTMQYQFTVEGMTCGHCERAVVHAVRELDNDAIIKVDLASKQVSVESEKSRDAVIAAIREEGYQVAA